MTATRCGSIVSALLITVFGAAVSMRGEPAEPVRIVFLAGDHSHGPGEHEFNAGCLLLAKALNEQSGLPVRAEVIRGWPADTAVLDGAKVVVVYGDGPGAIANDWTATDALARSGKGFVFLQAIHPRKGDAERYFQAWIGGAFEDGWSANPHWIADLEPLAGHPVSRGITGPVVCHDEFSYGLRFRPERGDVRDLVTATPTRSRITRYGTFWCDRGFDELGKKQTLMWAVERPDGGRGLGFSGGHLHRNWAVDGFRTLVLNAIVWTAGIDVPPGGVASKPVTEDDLNANLDDNGSKKLRITPPTVAELQAMKPAWIPPPDSKGERRWTDIPDADLAKLMAAVPASAVVQPRQPRKLLVFYRTDGYVHGSIPYWNHLLKAMGEKTGAYAATLSQNYDDLMPDRLANYDAVFFNNTCRMRTPEPVKTALLAFVRSGKGFAGNHGAGDNWHDWPEGLEMLGGEFVSHPFGAAQLKPEDPASPLTKVFAGKTFPFADELYAFCNGVDRSKVRVLISIDYPNSPGVMAACERARAAGQAGFVNDANDYALSWIRHYGGGRVFYCALGHGQGVPMNPLIAAYFLAGIQYAIGDLEADDSPTVARGSKAQPADQPAVAGSGPSFTRDIKGIISNRCVRCHGPAPDGRAGGGDEGLRLDTFAGATADLGGHAAIVPGKPDESEIMARVTSTDPDLVMPPPDAGERLSENQVDLLKRWISAGANYEPHWSHVRPKRPALPVVGKASWTKNEIDRFILARLEAERLSPQPESDRAALARRLALDLTGLPMRPEDIDAFVNDPAADAEEKLVDRLLSHEGYGEHMASEWLDLARYADSAGYADDPARTIWPYRDWVVHAFDTNMPFDAFTIRQLAGDLLPDATLDDKVATAFHRNTLTNNEGGTSDEEFRSAAIIDRVNTTMSTWMGSTMACAQCHDHKYDALTQREYFKLYAIFNNTADADRKDEAPVVEIRWEPIDAERAVLREKIAEIEAGIPHLAKPASKDRAEPPELGPARKIVNELRDKLARTPAATVPVLEELAGDKRRVTKIQLRGNWQNLGDTVTEGLPAAFSAAPVGESGRIDRMALAKWLVDPANPLTARVVVNRIWERLFGIGIVATSEEFGSQGDLPSHPELLDWLATELIARQWDVKAIQRLIVTSAAYRQTSKCPPELVARDPENRLLARGPRARLSAEVIRDQALAASGLLSPKKGGPSVKPPQPTLGLSAAFGAGIDWRPSSGEDRYRRALYTTWRRSNPYPSMATFDAPSREVCTIRRPRTNTPLQALVTLNDPAYVEAAQALARRMVREGAATAADRATRGFRLVLARRPTAAEIERLVTLHDEAAAEFRTDPAAAAKMATDPLGPIPSDLGTDAADLAAWTVVANVILNLDETFMCP